METPFVFTLHENLPRQGPGSNACTRKAFSMLADLPARPEVLDIGCGAGMQTVELARTCPGCRITATDVHQPFLDDLARRAASGGVGDRITILRASMDDLPFPDASFDVLWAEGSIFIVGFREGLVSWRRLLRPGGYLCLTESVWFTEDPSPEAAAFWNDCYPAIKTVPETCAIAEDAGYEVVATFPLPKSAWWGNYYVPVLKRIEDLRPKVAGNPEAEAQIEFAERETAVYREHADEYGYEFFILQKKE
ncbi:class I SAM-dependent methyltransferase [Methanoculleus sp. YWC-01]|uniref:Class I SAM-dependent methyltransferase n=1 Tax=Methanoculleus nereidis TaxID=2735141 RepID=A0ABU3Z4P6_9EURY|nr:class I SAM-dependent methyltransferase [Methanoculleus sp. YWC-01]MCK9298868.1 class I SAM-dependent methyltransferase [Methanoculleus sp.]MDV4343756.1 class I SAM-dependent methyltransferase [Methanoculleus sp. YWC-01]